MSFKDQILAARTAAVSGRTEDFAIPGYGGRLWGTFRVIDSLADVHKLADATMGIDDEADRDACGAADALVAASVDTFYIDENDARQPLGVKLGLPLARYLEMTAAENDRQAVFEIFERTGNLSVWEFYLEVDAWMTRVRAGVDKGLAGKSEAPS